MVNQYIAGQYIRYMRASSRANMQKMSENNPHATNIKHPPFYISPKDVVVLYPSLSCLSCVP